MPKLYGGKVYGANTYGELAGTNLSKDTVKRLGTKPTPHTGLVAEQPYAFVNTGRSMLRITNGGAVATVVTMFLQKLVDELEINPRETEIPKNTVEVFGPFPIDVYSDELEEVVFQLSSTAEVTVEIIELPRS